jgi:hypothetical protein
MLNWIELLQNEMHSISLEEIFVTIVTIWITLVTVTVLFLPHCYGNFTKQHRKHYLFWKEVRGYLRKANLAYRKRKQVLSHHSPPLSGKTIAGSTMKFDKAVLLTLYSVE